MLPSSFFFFPSLLKDIEEPFFSSPSSWPLMVLKICVVSLEKVVNSGYNRNTVNLVYWRAVYEKSQQEVKTMIHPSADVSM